MFDFIFGDKDSQQNKKVENLRKKLNNIWVQSPDRYYAADQLLEIATPDAFEAILERFKTQVQNTTYDIEEKQYLCDRLVNIGEPVVDIIKDVVRKEELQINWPMRVLEDILPDHKIAEFIQELLASMDLDYMRDPEKKQQLILRANSYKDYEDLAREVARFASDDSEAIRFQSVSQVVERDTDWAAAALQDNLRIEDSGRILALVSQWFVDHPQYKAIEDIDDVEVHEVDFVRDHLPRGYSLTDDGYVRG
jgi:hypothetical protein